MATRGLGSALWAAVSGLTASHTALGTVSENVANVNNPDYSEKTVSQSEIVNGNGGGGVEVRSIQRMIDEGLVRALRTQVSQQSEIEARMDSFASLSSLFGRPEDLNGLGTQFTDLQNALVSYLNTPGDTAADRQVIESLTTLIDRLGSFSRAVQTQRQEADSEIESTVNRISELTQRIADLNTQMVHGAGLIDDHSDVEDHLDAALSELESLIDIHVVERPGGIIHVYTRAGVQLVGDEPTTLTHSAVSSISAEALYGRGGLTPIMARGEDITESIKGGRLRGLLDIRDVLLPQMQMRLDELAHNLLEGFNGAHNLGTAFPGQTDMVGSRQFIHDGQTGAYTQPITFAQGDVFFVLSDDSGEAKFSGSLLKDIMSPAFRDSRTEGPTDLAKDIQQFLRTHGAANATAAIEEGRLAIHLNQADLHLSFYETATGDPADGVSPMLIHFNGAGEQNSRNDEVVSGFSNFFGLNDLLVRPVDDSVYESDLLSPSFKTSRDSLLYFYTDDQGTGSEHALPQQGLLIPAGSNLEKVADLINRDLEIYGHVHAVIENHGGQQRLVLEGDGSLAFSDETLAPFFTAIGLKRSIIGVAQTLKLKEPIAANNALMARGYVSYDATRGSFQGFSVSRGARQVIGGLREVLAQPHDWPPIGGLAISAATMGEYADDFTASVTNETYGQQKAYESQTNLVEEMANRSASIRGVSLDEEMSRMILYQQSYAASARMISTIKDMIDTLMNMV